MTIRIFHLPNQNRIEIDDRGPQGRPNEILDAQDIIRINGHAYTLNSIETLDVNNPNRRAWDFLRIELGIVRPTLSGVNLSQAYAVFDLRARARNLLDISTQYPAPELRQKMEDIFNASNELAGRFGFSPLIMGAWQGLSAFIPHRPVSTHFGSDCFEQSGIILCFGQTSPAMQSTPPPTPGH
ncbi:MAG: hypothetical protein U1F57_10335 [bacterium]